MPRSFGQFVREQRTPLPIVPTPEDCKGRTFVVTGANVGLGYECAKHFVELSAKRVIIAVRTISKGEAAKAAIEKATGRTGVLEVWQLDLASFQSVKSFVDKINALDRVDAVVENAAVAMAEYQNAEGLESTLTVNVVSTLLMAALLMPKLQACAKQFKTTPHIALIGSEVAFDPVGELEKLSRTEDILDQIDKAPMHMNRYPISKLLLFYAYREWTSQHPASQTGVVVNYVNPGLCTTELARNAPFLISMMIKTMRLFLARTAEVGARTELHGAFAGEASHGKYLSACDIKESTVPDWTSSESGRAIQQQVWESVSRRLRAVQPNCV